MPRPPVFAAALVVQAALLTSVALFASHVYAQPDLDDLFAPPTPAEITALAADWSTRAVAPTDWTVVRDATSAGFGLQAVSHDLEGLTHYGVLRYPRTYEPGERYPVLVLLHGGFHGLDLNWVLTFDEDDPSQCIADGFLVVAPTYRGEMLNGYGILPTRVSEGEPSFFDRDCDDSIALLTAVLENVPAADADRVYVLGGSRGGNVAYRMALRDPRVKRTSVRYGPTDFRLPHVEAGAREWVDTGATDDRLGELVGEHVAGPYMSGAITLTQARHDLLAWSVVPHLKAGLWLQVHHGERDDVVPIAQSAALDAAMVAKGAEAPEYAYHVYPGGSHTPTSLTGHEALVESFLCVTPSATDAAATPAPLRLGAAPNPFGASVTLTARGEAAKSLAAPLEVRILDVRGRLVRTLDLDPAAAVVWDGRDAAGRAAPSGTYFALPRSAPAEPTRLTRLR